MKYILSLLVAFTLSSIVTLGAQTAVQGTPVLPVIFQLGEFEPQMDEESRLHKTQLLTACDYDIELAYGKWISMIKEIESYSNRIDFDIKGVKVWLNVFYEKNGEIGHLGYYLKPNSRNVDKKEFAAFLKSFVNNYSFPHTFSEPFSHYGSAGFPTSAYEVPISVDTSSAGKGN